MPGNYSKYGHYACPLPGTLGYLTVAPTVDSRRRNCCKGKVGCCPGGLPITQCKTFSLNQTYNYPYPKSNKKSKK